MAIPYVKQTWTDGSGGGTPVSAARLAVIESGVFDAHYQPAVRVFHSAAQSISSGVITALAFNSERFDQASNTADTMHDTVTNNSRLTCRYAGVYTISGNVVWASSVSNASGSVLQIRLNGTTSIAVNQFFSCDLRQLSIATHYSLAVNDYVELCVTQNTGGAVSINSAANYSPEFSMVRVA